MLRLKHMISNMRRKLDKEQCLNLSISPTKQLRRKKRIKKGQNKQSAYFKKNSAYLRIVKFSKDKLLSRFSSEKIDVTINMNREDCDLYEYLTLYFMPY